MQRWHLKRKLGLYLSKKATPQTIEQIEQWLSDSTLPLSPPNEQQLQEEEKEILGEIQVETEYPLFYPGTHVRDRKNVILVAVLATAIILLALFLTYR